MSHQWFRVPLEGWRKIVEESGPREKAAQILYVTLHVNLGMANHRELDATNEDPLHQGRGACAVQPLKSTESA
jgi:hypothetical protein